MAKKELENKDKYSIEIYADKDISFYNDMTSSGVLPAYSFKVTEAENGYLDRVEEDETVLGKYILKRWKANMVSSPSSICAFVYSHGELLYAYEINPNNDNIRKYNASEVYMRNGMEFDEIRTHRKNYLVKEISRLSEVIKSKKFGAVLDAIIGGAATLESLFIGKFSYDQIRFCIDNRNLGPAYNQVIFERSILAGISAFVTTLLIGGASVFFKDLRKYWKLRGGRNKLQDESDTIEGRRR